MWPEYVNFLEVKIDAFRKADCACGFYVHRRKGPDSTIMLAPVTFHASRTP